MTNNTHYFHFTLGPVQGFVSQARRTRDFWAGSFILSWLSAVAMKAVHVQYPDKPLKDVILFPAPDPNFMLWLEGKGTGKAPTQGSIPNRFKAAIDPNTFDPDVVTNAVKEAWKALAKEVWKTDLSKVSNGVQCNIWNRQINNFWEMSWVITPDVSDSSVLDQRKNWRTYAPTEEPGVKCAMMDGWQELSGEKRPNRNAMNENFWDKVLNQGTAGMKSDLRPNEALCAIALVKRRFSRYFANLKHPMKQGWQLKGWEVPTAVPSVVYMAAVHWLEQLLSSETVNTQLLKQFHDEAYLLTGKEYGEIKAKIKCLENLKHSHILDQLKALDGNVFFESSLENPNIFADQKQAETVLTALNDVRNSTSPKLPQPSPFYAILMMDGDSLGSHMSDPNKQTAITNGLANFTQKVPSIVYQHSGFLIYAGGDDVLAILPLEDAIACATELRTHYMSCFDYKQIPTTLSGAIEFTHIHTPLTSVLQDAHRLLDDVAKEGSGRDALAIRVWKRGGLQLEWSQPWKIAINIKTGKAYLEELAERFQKANTDDDQFSNKFFYKIRECFDLLNPDITKKQEPILDDDNARSLMAMEYLNSGKSDVSTLKNAKERIEEAKAIIEPLLTQCRPVTRLLEDNKELPIEKWTRSKRLEADGALLVRFLAQKGVEK